MIIRFWGTRGSLPVAPKADAIRRKVASALVAADGRRFVDADEALEFVERGLKFETEFTDAASVLERLYAAAGSAADTTAAGMPA